MAAESAIPTRSLSELLSLEYGAPLPERVRTGAGFAVFGSSGEVGRHSTALVLTAGIIVGRKGTAGAVTWSPSPFWPIDTTYYVRSLGPDLRWLYWALSRLPLARLEASTGVPGLNRHDAYRLRTPVPSLGEQRRIAEILDTLDQAIQKTRQLIAKLKQMRQGLLHDLLTRGIDENGELRDPERHPEQFQEMELGRMPRQWEQTALESAVRSDAQITYGIVQAGPNVPEGVPYIRTGDMSGDELRVEGLLRASKRIAASYRRSRVEAGEIVCAIRATVGKVLRVPQELDGANLTQGTARIAPRRELNASFVLWALRSHLFQRQVALSIKGTTFQEITLAQLRRLTIPIPKDRREQDGIAGALDAADARIAAEARETEKLIRIRSGLVEDLLTGRVRVTRLVGEALKAERDSRIRNVHGGFRSAHRSA